MLIFCVKKKSNCVFHDSNEAYCDYLPDSDIAKYTKIMLKIVADNLESACRILHSVQHEGTNHRRDRTSSQYTKT